MIPKEQIAHDLTMVYLGNKYGVSVNGYFSVDSDSFDDRITRVGGSGRVETTHLPDVDTPQYIKVGTGQKCFLGFEKKERSSIWISC